MLNHYEQAENLHYQLKLALDKAFKEHNHFAVMQLAEALSISAKYMQYPTDDNLHDLGIFCGAPEVIAAFEYRNPCQDFVWVTFN